MRLAGRTTVPRESANGTATWADSTTHVATEPRFCRAQFLPRACAHASECPFHVQLFTSWLIIQGRAPCPLPRRIRMNGKRAVRNSLVIARRRPIRDAVDRTFLRPRRRTGHRLDHVPRPFRVGDPVLVEI